ncbi:MAG: valine--tRNA ligase [Oscillospiraceae bacterium]|jgi:valyl-tRNA synthetase|nr:valine--tRNA ligase [Oscillospiraceae bacterium]
MEKNYSPQEFESEIYQAWEESGSFAPKIEEGKKPFTIVIPPPNITGQLHVGHAMDTSIQDCLTRYHRMIGDPTLWLPGTDHASIATEVKILDAMRAEGLTKETLGREGFLERAWDWKNQYGGAIVRQLRRLGGSCDWSRERFTMDEGCSSAVREVFVSLYEKGLIYRANRIINWCPECKTALSDAEVEYEEQASSLWHIRYPGDGFDITVATTRPETMLGDTGIAVHPEDSRYAAYVGKSVTLPIMNRRIPIVADSYVEKEFGSGAVKMTPAHDPNDYEIAQRHNLAIIRVMNDDGTMNERAGEFAGLPAPLARKLIVAKLEEQGLLVKVEPYTHNVGLCYRCHHTVEPLTSDQWFVKMEPLAKPAIEAVRSGSIEFVPERYSSTYFHWMENIRDWCISRQLWWGHRIPAWFCRDCGHINVSRTTPESCEKCGGVHLRQDEDVMDTWFSSALWPFSTLGWPEKTSDLAYFYPTSVLVTSYDIIFFWVARMIFSGIEQMGEPPFHTVLIHGLVRDANGKKMSKSAGNGIDPIEVIETYGADALRLSLIMGLSPGTDTRLSTEKLEAARNFANKLWNAARFVLSNADDGVDTAGDVLNTAGEPGARPYMGLSALDRAENVKSVGASPRLARGSQPSPVTPQTPTAFQALQIHEKWILTRLNRTIEDVSRLIEQYDLGLAATTLYEFVWNQFCDWSIELAKPALFGDDAQAKRNARAVLLYVLDAILKMLHPFIPFITEKIYGMLPDSADMLINAEWAKPSPYADNSAEEAMDGIIEIVRTVRSLRLERKVQAGKKTRLYLLANEKWSGILAESTQVFQRLAGASDVIVIKDRADIPEPSVKAVTSAAEIILPLGELVDFAAEKARINKAIDSAKGEIERAQRKLANDGFIAKAPASLIEDERKKIETQTGVLQALEQQLGEVESM